MGLVSSKDILVPARESGYAVGAFNTSNLEITQAILEAAQELKSPVLIATSSSAIKYAGFKNIYCTVKNIAEDLDVKVALHLDHGADLEICKACLDNGWTSIMIDASKYDFEENISITRSVVEEAHKVGVPVEAELGKLTGIEDEVIVAHPGDGWNLPSELPHGAEALEDCVVVEVFSPLREDYLP